MIAKPNRIKALILVVILPILAGSGCSSAPPYVKKQSGIFRGYDEKPCFQKLDNGTVLEKPCPSDKTAGKVGSLAAGRAAEGRKHRAWRHCNEELCRQDCPEGEELIWARGPDGKLRHGSAQCTCEAGDCGNEPAWER